MHGTLWNAISISLICLEFNVIDTLRFNNDANFLYRLATALEMRPNHEHWCKCTWQTNGNNKQPQVTDLTSVSPLTVGLPVTSERYWACFQFTRLFHSATILFCYICILVFETSPGWLPGWRVFFNRDLVGRTHFQCIYYLCRILISRPPRAFRRFKRRSCSISHTAELLYHDRSKGNL